MKVYIHTKTYAQMFTTALTLFNNIRLLITKK